MPNLNLFAVLQRSLVIKIDSNRRAEVIPDDLNQENFPSVWSARIYSGNSNDLMLIFISSFNEIIFKVLNKVCFLSSRVGQIYAYVVKVSVGDKKLFWRVSLTDLCLLYVH